MSGAPITSRRKRKGRSSNLPRERPFLLFNIALKLELGSELNLPRRRGSSGHQTRRGRNSRGRRGVYHLIWRGEVGVVEDIEELGPELQPQPFSEMRASGG